MFLKISTITICSTCVDVVLKIKKQEKILEKA